MKILHQDFGLNQFGTAKILLEEHDDLWLIYNLIAKDDTIVTDTTRKVVHDKASSSASASNTDRDCPKVKTSRKECSRVNIRLEIKVKGIDYDKDSSIVRVKGRNLVSNELMASGAHHSMEIEKNKEFDLTKKVWDSDSIEILQEGVENKGADLAVIMLQQGLCQVFLVGQRTTKLCAKIEASTTDHNNKNGLNKFYQAVFQAFVKHVNFSTVRCVVLGSPGSIKQEFRCFLFQEAQKQNVKSIQDNKSRFVMVNTGKNDGLKEILHDKEVMGLIKNTKASLEIKAYNEFSDLLRVSDRACYGARSVEMAQEMKAIETLLITDDLVRNNEIALRQKYMGLVKSVKKAGGKVFVFSSMHVSGEELSQLTGIAAILRFPLPDLDELML